MKLEIKRCLLNLNLYISIFLCVGILYYGLTDYSTIGFSGDVANYKNAYQAWFDAIYISPKATFILIAPLIASLPMSYLFLEERESGHLKNIIYRIKDKEYIKVRLIINGISGGLAVSLPCIAIFVLCSFMYPRALPSTPSNTWGFSPHGVFSNLFLQNPDLYIVINIMQIFVFGFICATIGMLVSFFTNKKSVTFLAPLILYTMSRIIIEFLLIFGICYIPIDPKYLLVPFMLPDDNSYFIYIEVALIIIIMITLYRKSKRKENIF